MNLLNQTILFLNFLVVLYVKDVLGFSRIIDNQQRSPSEARLSDSEFRFDRLYLDQIKLKAKKSNDDDRLSSFLRDENSSISTSSKLPMTTSFGSDSVPQNQQPSNEYQELIRAPLFDWAMDETGDVGLAVRLLVTYIAFFGTVCWPIAGATYVMDGYFLQKFTAANVGSMGVIFALLVRLYTGWGYIGARLKSKVIEYEETGWYDGAVEEKTKAEIARDLMLYRQDVAPVEERVKSFTAGVGALLLISCLALNISVNSKPLFNEYDPALLEQLRSNDLAADIAQQKSGSRPTYCDNRYYRAVANGGQGCE